MISTSPTLFSLFAFIVFVSGCLPDDRSVLLRLKKGFSFSKLESWQPNTNCCQWSGILRESGSGNVVDLDLSSQGISGRIDSSLSNLTSLRVLNLDFNHFDGSPIPSYGWEKLGNLTHMNLSCLRFEGQIPIGISRLNNLVSLDLSSSYKDVDLSSLEVRDPDLGALLQGPGNLRVLYLNGVNISAKGEEWCGSLARSTPELQELSLADCSLSGGIGFSLSKLRSLIVIHLSRNILNSTVPDLFVKFTSLSLLRLHLCKLKGLFPKDIFQLKNLTISDFSNNPMLYVSLPDFTKDNVLESLVLSGTNFFGLLPDTISNLKSLKVLRLSDCHTQGKIPSSLFQVSGLRGLSLANNNFTGFFQLNSILLFKNLSYLDLSNNGLSYVEEDDSSSIFIPKDRDVDIGRMQFNQDTTFLEVPRSDEHIRSLP